MVCRATADSGEVRSRTYVLRIEVVKYMSRSPAERLVKGRIHSVSLLLASQIVRASYCSLLQGQNTPEVVGCNL